ncbi:MAG: CHAT domain-containing protein [Deltaproteobacteria bacterium]|nr:CHAT domain-containing protein [Deltaproteobacteria bacterium]
MESQIKDVSSAGTNKLWYLCTAYSRLKEYNKLFPCLDQLDRNFEKGDRTVNMYDISAVPSILRAEAYMDFGNYGQAVEQATMAYEIVQKRDLSRWIRIQALSVVALAQALKGDRAKAEEYARLLEDIGTAYPFILLKTDKLSGLARIYMAQGDFQRSLAIIKEDAGLGWFRGFVQVTVLATGLMTDDILAFSQLPKAFILNKSLYETGQVQEAKAGYDKLLAIPQTKDNGDIYWLILSDRGKIAEAEGNLKEAIDFYQKAIEVIERQRSSINTEASKIGFVGNKQQVYHALIRALFADGQQAKAFEYVERSKSRALVDLLASKKDFAASGANPQQVAALLTELETQEAGARVQKTESVRGSRAAGVKQRLKSVSPELASLVTVAPVAAANIQSLLQPDEALVEYYYEGNDLYAFIVTREGVKGVKLDGAKLADDIRQFRVALKQPQTQSYVAPAQKLYARLIQPVEASLHHKELLIVAHGVLHYLPFDALLSGKEYLIDRYSIRQLPSASVLQFLKSRQGSPSAGVLALGNPDLGNPKYDLKCAQDEVVFSYVHFATHGQFDADKPLNSGLLLAKDAQSDGFLSLGELYSVRLNADLVTLSACETGLGKVGNGDDVVGLTRGFLYAGSNTIVASLWEVDDQATSYLMEEFYANLKKGNKRDALRQAQLATKKKFEHPYYWAAFELTGKI